MTILTQANVLTDLMSEYTTARQRIQTSDVYSENEKKRRSTELFNQYKTRAENSVQNLWGAINVTEEGSKILSADAEIWVSLARAELNLRKARDNASKVSFPSGADHAIHRLRTILRLYGLPHEFMQWYHTEASTEERHASQDYLAGMVSGHEWNTVIVQMKLDRQERVSTREVATAEAALEQVYVDAGVAAAPTIAAKNEFGRESYYLNEFDNGVFQHPVTAPRLARKTWGIAVMANGRGNVSISNDGTIYGGSSE